MLEILIGLACGMAVCVFGLFCFIKGQRNALQLQRNEIPEDIRGPIAAFNDAVVEAQEREANGQFAQKGADLMEQILNAQRGGDE